jgi:hypothetical protein
MHICMLMSQPNFVMIGRASENLMAINEVSAQLKIIILNIIYN